MTNTDTYSFIIRLRRSRCWSRLWLSLGAFLASYREDPHVTFVHHQDTHTSGAHQFTVKTHQFTRFTHPLCRGSPSLARFQVLVDVVTTLCAVRTEVAPAQFACGLRASLGNLATRTPQRDDMLKDVFSQLNHVPVGFVWLTQTQRWRFLRCSGGDALCFCEGNIGAFTNHSGQVVFAQAGSGRLRANCGTVAAHAVHKTFAVADCLYIFATLSQHMLV